MNNDIIKRECLRQTMFKLLKNQPYNTVWTKVERIGRQIAEIDSKYKLPNEAKVATNN